MNTYSKWLFKTFFATLGLLGLSAIFGKFVFLGPVYDTNRFKIDRDIDTIIVGASHAATALSTEFIPNAENFARSGEPIFFTYYKTKKILQLNPHIKRIIVALSPIHIGRYADAHFFKGNSASRIYTMDYFMFVDRHNDPLIPLLSSDHILAVLKYHAGIPFNYMDDLKVFIKHYLGNINIRDYRYAGGYEEVKGVHLDENAVAEKAHFYFYGEGGGSALSKIGTTSIERLLNLTNEFGIQAIVLNTPMHESFRTRIPEQYQTEYQRLMNTYAGNNPLIHFYDFSSLKFPNAYFYDGDHLNDVGSKVFSRRVSHIVKNTDQLKTNR